MRALFTLLMSLALAVPAVTWADIPPTMSYQGVLADDMGEPVGDGEYDLTFRIYDQASGGSALWTETQTVTVTGGVFDALLGSTTPIDLTFAVPCWLGVSVEGESELDPRVEIASTPYAYRAAIADSVVGGGGSGADSDWIITGDDMYSGVPGDIGIGTSTPSSNLHVSDVQSVELFLEADTDNSGEYDQPSIAMSQDGGVVDARIGFFDGNNDLQIIHESSGADTSSLKFISNRNIQTNGDLLIGGGLDTYDGSAEVLSISGRSDFWAMGCENTATEEQTDFFIAKSYAPDGKFHIQHDGNVGIGTWEPAERLDVVGTAQVEGLKVTSSPTAGHVLTCQDASGTAAWAEPGELTLPYEGSISHDAPAFSVTNTDDTVDSYGIYVSGEAALKAEHNVDLGWNYHSTKAILGMDALAVFGINNNEGGWPGNRGSLGGEGWGVQATSNPHNDNYDIVNAGALAGDTTHTNNPEWTSDVGVWGRNGMSETEGWLGGPKYGAYGVFSLNGNYGALGGQSHGLLASGSTWAGYFHGNVRVNGNFSKASGTFEIDHPLDPANKYLYHSFVESPDMKNIYDGTVALDVNGEAWVELPEWFDALNSDFRYQLTTIGGFAPVYIAEKISGNRFKIAGGHSGMEVSWQVTGIRQDPYAEAHRVQVEVEKPAHERGYYLHPELYGQPTSRGIDRNVVPVAIERTTPQPVLGGEQINR